MERSGIWRFHGRLRRATLIVSDKDRRAQCCGTPRFSVRRGPGPSDAGDYASGSSRATAGEWAYFADRRQWYTHMSGACPHRLFSSPLRFLCPATRNGPQSSTRRARWMPSAARFSPASSRKLLSPPRAAVILTPTHGCARRFWPPKPRTCRRTTSSGRFSAAPANWKA